MDTAIRATKLSHAVRLKTGAIIVADGNIISYGYNGTPAGDDNNCEEMVFKNAERFLGDHEYPFIGDGIPYRLITKDSVIHAEENAILKAARSTYSTKGATMYCSHAPCVKCARMIHSVGIRRLVYKDTYRLTSGLELLQNKDIDVVRM